MEASKWRWRSAEVEGSLRPSNQGGEVLHHMHMYPTDPCGKLSGSKWVFPVAAGVNGLGILEVL